MIVYLIGVKEAPISQFCWPCYCPFLGGIATGPLDPNLCIRSRSRPKWSSVSSPPAEPRWCPPWRRLRSPRPSPCGWPILPGSSREGITARAVALLYNTLLIYPFNTYVVLYMEYLILHVKYWTLYAGYWTLVSLQLFLFVTISLWDLGYCF